jgi:phosphoglycolate phosphatase-like HAD superfamily hydrolase
MTESLRAAVFDLDGTVLDTREFIFRAYEHSLGLHGYEVPNRTLIAEQIGKSLPDCYEAFAPEGELAVLCQSHHEFQANKIDIIIY